MPEPIEEIQQPSQETTTTRALTPFAGLQDEALPWGGVHVEALIGRVKAGAGRIAISGLHGSGLAYMIARVAQVRGERPLVILCADNQRAYQLYEEISFYCGQDESSSQRDILHYAADEILPYSEMLPDRGAIQSRLRVLMLLQQSEAPILIMPIAALLRKVMPRVELSHRSELIELFEEVDREALIEQLMHGGYQRVPVVEDGGTFAVRGAILDIYSPLYNYPARIEFDDTLVSSIKFFDPTTQRTHDEAKAFLLGPVDETLINRDTLQHARKRLADLADALEYPTLELERLLDDLRQGLRPFGLQRLMPGFYGQLDSLFDYLPQQSILLIDEPQSLKAEAAQALTRMEEAYEAHTKEGGLAFPPKDFLLSWEDTENRLRRYSRIEHRAVLQLASTSHGEAPPSSPQMRADGVLEMPFSTASHLQLRQRLRALANAEERRLQPLVERIRLWRNEKLRVVIVCGSRGQALRQQELLALYKIEAYIWHDHFHPDREAHLGQHGDVDLFVGRIGEGFLFPNAKLVILSEEEIFGPKARRRSSKPKNPLSETELESLKRGDIIIHREYGLSRYGGLHTMQIGETTGDYILLEYQGKDRLYLPITRLALIERHTGGGNPPLDRLKGNTFDKKVTKAKAAIQAMAGSLLQLYAARQAHEGTPFPAPDSDYYEFAARFPFEETPDQWRAIEDVLADLQAPRPMDRLICGDVGYGKTEVAMRAAFLAAYGGRQVAVLVPTTVLAQQHYLNFTERFESFPIKIGILSRFQSTKENKDTLKRLAEGNIDIIVSTHRILSRDVRFKDLGLLIIDEEHRFGVRHKERIKTMRESIDALTMTATPIPRTLEMGITGLRDLSLITTPPHDRLAIRTSIAPYDEQVIREAIMRELSRGGQVFFVHNRVESIGEIQEKLSRIVPEARIVVGHAQMPEGELERVMLDFVQGKYNLLIATTIIESGIDIARANTILINRADTFGLAQLYQIRGRVGRSRERAYAILLVPANKRLTPEAHERLTTLQRFSELGAGFEIARYDLEMRGAGNLLGKQQSGHVHAIGLELYLEMLEETIAELQGKPRRHFAPPEVKVNVDTFIPDRYVPDVQLRLQCYRRLSSAETNDEFDELMDEFCDRFGEAPPEVQNLFLLMEITQILASIHASHGEVSRHRFRIFFRPDAPLKVDFILQLAQRPEPPIRMLPQSGIELQAPLPEGTHCLRSIRSALRELPLNLLVASQESNQ